MRVQMLQVEERLCFPAENDQKTKIAVQHVSLALCLIFDVDLEFPHHGVRSGHFVLRADHQDLFLSLKWSAVERQPASYLPLLILDH